MLAHTTEITYLQDFARRCRIDILTSLACAGSGHIGGSLSAIDIITTIYNGFLRVDPANPKDPNRDRFVLSKGHAAPALYTPLARLGFFERKHLWTLRKLHSILQGHPDMHRTPGVDFSTGSLGQGISCANGMAYAAKLDGSDRRVYTVLSDGENQEGQVWEAAQTAAHWKLDNLMAFIDFNKLETDGTIAEIKGLEPLHEKWASFGWHTLRIDGHDFNALIGAIEEGFQTKGKPTAIVCDTIKGYPVSVFAGNFKYHGVSPETHELIISLDELKADFAEDTELWGVCLGLFRKLKVEKTPEKLAGAVAGGLERLLRPVKLSEADATLFASYQESLLQRAAAPVAR